MSSKDRGRRKNCKNCKSHELLDQLKHSADQAASKVLKLTW